MACWQEGKRSYSFRREMRIMRNEMQFLTRFGWNYWYEGKL